MLIRSIDTSRLKHDIDLLIADCIFLKSSLRARWLRPMADEQRRLVFVRRKLTERFVLLAASRKRLHVKTPPADVRDASGSAFDASAWNAAAHAEAIVSRLLPEYDRARGCESATEAR